MNITFIGAGNMGGAIAEGALAHDFVTPEQVVIADPGTSAYEKLRSQGYAVRHTSDNKEAVRGARIVIIAVKPWLMEQVLKDIAVELDRSSQVLVSIAAGVTFEQMEAWLDTAKYGPVPLCRVIPNTAISLGESMTFICRNSPARNSAQEVTELFQLLGEVMEIPEDQCQAATALASSGIAYALRYIDSSVKGGVEMGLSADISLDIVIQTVKGAIALLEKNGSRPQQEIDRVTTPGGITLKGLEAMETNGFTEAVIKGLLATK